MHRSLPREMFKGAFPISPLLNRFAKRPLSQENFFLLLIED